MKVSLVILGAALLSGGVANAEVVVTANLPTERVSFADLNLGSQWGQDTLRGRIRHAASNVCGATPTYRPVRENMFIRSCYNGAVADGYRQMATVVAGANGAAQLAAAATLTIQAR
jgi:UrcA family protein